MSSRPENRRPSSIQRSEPTFIVDSGDEDIAPMPVDHPTWNSDSDDSNDGWHFKDKKGKKYYPRGHHSSQSVTQHPEHAAQSVTRADDSDARGSWHFKDRTGRKYYPGGPSSAVDHYARPVDMDMNEDTRPRHSIITAQAVKETFNVINTHYPYLHCPIPSWVQNAGPDEHVLNSPTFVRAWHAFRFLYQKMWATLDPSDHGNHEMQVAALNQAIHRLDQAYHRALGH